MRALLVALCLALLVAPVRADSVVVFAAASLKNAFDAIGAAFTAETGVEVVFSYAGTSVLARQIEQGAPADLFVSAHPVWVDYLQERGLIDREGQAVFASNQLVVIAPSAGDVALIPDLSLADAWLDGLDADGRLAIALVDAVPAGLYAREALESLGVWQALEPRLAQSDNVRSALFLVARGEAPLGIVYASDAAAEPSVSVVAHLPPNSHSVVRYTALRVAENETPFAEQFVTFLLQPEAQDLLRAAEFQPPISANDG